MPSPNVELPESVFVSCLIQNEISLFKSYCLKQVDGFYKKSNPLSSMDKSFIVKLISEVHRICEEGKEDINYRLAEMEMDK